MRRCLAGLLAACLGSSTALPQGSVRGQGPERTLYFFFSPRAPSSVEAAKGALAFKKAQKGPLKIRPVLLLEDFGVLRKVEEASPIYKTLKELQHEGPLEIPLYDLEGLELALGWDVRSVPAFVLVSGGRAHRALGPVVKFEDLLKCDR